MSSRTKETKVPQQNTQTERIDLGDPYGSQAVNDPTKIAQNSRDGCLIFFFLSSSVVVLHVQTGPPCFFI